MIIETLTLAEPVKRQVVRLLKQIDQATSMIQAVKSGARADGFVLGLETVGALSHGEVNDLHLFFETALEARLRALAQ